MATFDYLVELGLSGKKFIEVVDALLDNLNRLEKTIELGVKDTTASTTINKVSENANNLRNTLKDMPFSIDNTKAKESVEAITSMVTSLKDTLGTMNLGAATQGIGTKKRVANYGSMKAQMVDVARIAKRTTEHARVTIPTEGIEESIASVEDYASTIDAVGVDYEDLRKTIQTMTNTTLFDFRRGLKEAKQNLTSTTRELKKAKSAYDALKKSIKETGSATDEDKKKLEELSLEITRLKNVEKGQATSLSKMDMWYKALIPSHLKLQQAMVDTERLQQKAIKTSGGAMKGLDQLEKSSKDLIDTTGNEAEAMSQLRTSFGHIIGSSTNVSEAITKIQKHLYGIRTEAARMKIGDTFEEVAHSTDKLKNHLSETRDINIDISKTTKNIQRQLNKRVVGEQKVADYNREQLALKRRLAATEGVQKVTLKEYSPTVGRELSGEEKYFANINGIVEEISRKDYRRMKTQERLNDLAKGFGGVATDILRKFALWGIAYRSLISMWQYAKKLLRDTLNTIVEMSRVSGQIAKVAPLMFGGTEGAKRMNTVMNEAISISIEYGTTMEKTADAMTLFFQQGLQTSEALKRSRGAMELATVSGLELNESVEVLTAGYKIYGDSIKEPRDLTNQLIAVEQKHAITARELSRAVLSAGNTAEEMGIKLHELLGFITAMGVSTRRTGKQIGTALRFILPRMLMGEAVEQFERLGITIYGLNQKGIPDLRAMGDVIQDVAVKWTNLSDAQKAYIAVSVAGRRRMNDFLALINNYPEALRSMQDALESEGRTEAALSVVTSKLDKQIVSVSNVFKRFAYLLGEAGISQALSGIYSAIIKLGGGTDRVRDKILDMTDVMMDMASAGQASLLNTADLVDVLLKRLEITPKSAGDWGLITKDIRTNVGRLIKQAKELEKGIKIPIRVIVPPAEVEAEMKKEFSSLSSLLMQQQAGYAGTKMWKDARRESLSYKDAIITIPPALSGVSNALKRLGELMDAAITADDREKVRMYGQALEKMTTTIQKAILERNIQTAKTIFKTTWATLLKSTEPVAGEASKKIAKKSLGTINAVVTGMRSLKLFEGLTDPGEVSTLADLKNVFIALGKGMESSNEITQRMSATWLQALGTVDETRSVLSETVRSMNDVSKAEKALTAFTDEQSKKRALESSNLRVLHTKLSKLGEDYSKLYKFQVAINTTINDRLRLQRLDLDRTSRLQTAYQANKEVFEEATKVYNDYFRVAGNVSMANVKLANTTPEVEKELSTLAPAMQKIARTAVSAMHGFSGTAGAQLELVRAIESGDAAKAIEVLSTKTTIMNDQSDVAKQQFKTLKKAIEDYVAILKDTTVTEEEVAMIREKAESAVIHYRDTIRSLKDMSLDYQQVIKKEESILKGRLSLFKVTTKDEVQIAKKQIEMDRVLTRVKLNQAEAEARAALAAGESKEIVEYNLKKKKESIRRDKEILDIQNSFALSVAKLSNKIKEYNDTVQYKLDIDKLNRESLKRLGVSESDLIDKQIQSINTAIKQLSVYSDVNKERIKSLRLQLKELRMQKIVAKQTEALTAAQRESETAGAVSRLTTIGLEGMTPGRRELLEMKTQYEASSEAVRNIVKQSGLSSKIQKELNSILDISDGLYRQEVVSRESAIALMTQYVQLEDRLTKLQALGVDTSEVSTRVDQLRLKIEKELGVVVDEQHKSIVDALDASEALFEASKQRASLQSNIRKFLGDEILYLTKSKDSQLNTVKQQKIQRVLLDAQIADRERELKVEQDLGLKRLDIARKEGTYTDAMSITEQSKVQAIKDGITQLKLQRAELEHMEVISKNLLYLQDALNAAKGITAGLRAFAAQRYERLQEEDRIKKQIELEKQRIALEEASGKKPARTITGEYADIRKLEIQLKNTRSKSKDEIIKGLDVAATNLRDTIENIRIKLADRGEEVRLQTMIQRLSNDFQGTVESSAEAFYNKAIRAAQDFKVITTGGTATGGLGGIYGTTGTTGLEKAGKGLDTLTEGLNETNKASVDFKKELIRQAAMLGPDLGTIVGGGGPKAGMYANIGTTVGDIVSLIPAISGFLGPYAPLVALGGGLIGGLIGKFSEQEESIDDNVDALEDNTRELKRNTEQLESLSERIISAPSGFQPPMLGGLNIGGIGGGGIQININASGRDPIELARSINEELSKVQRRGSNITPNQTRIQVLR